MANLVLLCLFFVEEGGVKDDRGVGGSALGDDDVNVCTICLDSMKEVCIFGLQCGLVSLGLTKPRSTGVHCLLN